MRTLRLLSIVAGGVAALGALAGTAAAQQTYGPTLYWGSGLVDIPVAWVSPLTGDFAINYSGKNFKHDPDRTKINYSSNINSQLTFDVAAFGRLEAGFAAYSSNPEYGFFGKALLLSEEQFRDQTGLAHWLPGIAIGIRNVGPYKRIDRFGIGYDLLPPGSDPNARHVADSLHTAFNTANSVYGVATKGFSLAEIRPSWPDVDLSFSVGYGNGLFKNHGDIPTSSYAKFATGGLFYGAKVDWTAAPNVTLGAMIENNAWDYNVGLVADYRGIRAGLYLTELFSGSAKPDSTNQPSYYFRYTKPAFTIGWQSNIFALLHGDFLQSRAAELERQRQGLLAEIQQRQQRIAALELEINRYEAQNLLELEQRRAQAEEELRQERETLQRLEERLRRVEQQQQPPPTNKPPRR